MMPARSSAEKPIQKPIPDIAPPQSAADVAKEFAAINRAVVRGEPFDEAATWAVLGRLKGAPANTTLDAQALAAVAMSLMRGCFLAAQAGQTERGEALCHATEDLLFNALNALSDETGVSPDAFLGIGATPH